MISKNLRIINKQMYSYKHYFIVTQENLGLEATVHCCFKRQIFQKSRKSCPKQQLQKNDILKVSEISLFPVTKQNGSNNEKYPFYNLFLINALVCIYGCTIYSTEIFHKMRAKLKQPPVVFYIKSCF